MIQRSAEQQARADAKAKSLKLYQLYACPFCVKTRRTIRRLNITIETLDVSEGSPYRTQLEQGGGKFQVPCLLIEKPGETTWMYESAEIIDYLNKEFSEDALRAG